MDKTEDNNARLHELRKKFGKNAEIHPDVVMEDMETLFSRLTFTYKKELEQRGIERGGYKYNHWVTLAMQWIAFHRNFHRHVLDPLVRRRTFRIPTMAVVAIGGRLELWYNPDFAALYSLRKTSGILMHESGHILNNHISRALRLSDGAFHKDRLHALAMDCAVNTTMQDPKDLPDNRIHPGLFKDPDSHEDPECWSNLPERRTYEEYYEMLSNIREKDPGQIEEIGGEERTYMVIEVGVGEDEAGEGASLPAVRPMQDIDPDALDDHSLWLAEEGMDADQVESIVKAHVRQAVESARNAGTSPGNWQSAIDELLKQKAVPWQKIFRPCWARLVRNARSRTILRPGRRTTHPPGSVRGPELDVIIYIDVSGSVDDEEVRVFLSEGQHAANNGGCRIMVQQFAEALIGKPMELLQYQQPDRSRLSHGGTAFGPVMLDVQAKRPDFFAVLTDGYNWDEYIVPSIPHAWILTNGGKKHGSGTTIRLPTIEEIMAGVRATAA